MSLLVPDHRRGELDVVRLFLWVSCPIFMCSGHACASMTFSLVVLAGQLRRESHRLFLWDHSFLMLMLGIKNR